MAIFALENFTNIPRETGRLVDELPEKRFIPNSSIPPRPKGLPLRRVPGVAESKIPAMKTWQGSRLKTIGLKVLPTYKSCGLFSGSRKNKERLPS
jgi:hypothetical protein